MPCRDKESLIDIINAGEQAMLFIEGLSQDEFYHDIKSQAAVIRQIEIIGEATKRLSEEFKDNWPKIRWRQMAGMRDILIHAYDHINIDLIWETLQRSIPDLIEESKNILTNL